MYAQSRITGQTGGERQRDALARAEQQRLVRRLRSRSRAARRAQRRARRLGPARQALARMLAAIRRRP